MAVLLSGISMFLILSLASLFAGPTISREDEIREMEKRELNALLKGDTETLRAIWAETLVVNSPLGTVNGREEVLARVRDGRISYKSFKRDIETIRLFGDLAVVMGSEDTVPAESHAINISRMKRRFTDVWMFGKGRWQEIARHANIVCEVPAESAKKD